MSARLTGFASARNLLCLGASILGLTALAFAVAPGTVLASTGGVYEEEEAPPTPTKPGNNGKGNSKDRNANGNGSGNNSPGSGSSTGSSGTGNSGTGSDDGSDSSGGSGGSNQGNKRYSNGQYNPATDSEKKPAGTTGQDDDDATIATVPAAGGGDGDGDGGSAWPVIIAILVGLPLLGGGGYLLWQRYRGSDDETREQLRAAVGSKSAAGPADKSGS